MKFILVLLVITSSIVSAQWNATITTNLSVQNSQYSELFSNSFGNNIVLQNTGGSITYHILNPSTGQTLVSKVIESSGSSLANITGDDNKVYIIYKLNSKIRGKYTTDSGESWSVLPELNADPGELDAVFHSNLLHIVFTSNNIVKYNHFNGTAWVCQKDVSEIETGYNPRIEPLFNDDKVYVAYNRVDANNFISKVREYKITLNQWGEIKQLYSGTNWSRMCGFGVDANYIYLFLSKQQSYDFNIICRKIRRSDYIIVSDWINPYNFTTNIQTITTPDGATHSAFYSTALPENVISGINHFSFPSGVLNVESVYPTPTAHPTNVEISAVYNDLFVTWKNESSNYLSYRQFDSNPAVPKNVCLSSYNGHPKILWSRNSDADVTNYLIYKKKGTAADFVLYASVPGNCQEYVDNAEFILFGPPVANETIAKYKVMAKDYGNHESGLSNEVVARIEGNPIEKNNEGNFICDYSLNQNYPNPFNPQTTISYEIKNKGFVSLKVYDMMGHEIAILVDDIKDPGSYSVNFNSENLSSGIYIYSFSINGYSENRKMTLLK